MAGKDNDGFAASINKAGEIPDDPGQGAMHELPSMFDPRKDFPIPKGDHVEDNVGDPKQIGGIPKLKYTAHFKRFIMGPICVGRDERGAPVITDNDDSIAYQNVLNEILEGRAIKQSQETKFTNEGGYIVALLWLVPKDEKPETKDDDGQN
jgi:hypothetical protein